MQRFVAPFLVLAILLASSIAVSAQGPGPTAAKPATSSGAPVPPKIASLLISADAEYAWTLDGDLQGTTSADMHPKTVTVSKLGTHEIVITSRDGKIKLRQTVTVKAGEQTVVHFTATSIEINGGAPAMGVLNFPTGADKAKYDKEVEENQRQLQLKHPENFGSVSATALKGAALQAPRKWQINIGVGAGSKYEPKVQMSVKDANGHWKQLPDALPANAVIYQILADDLGTEAVVCFTAKSSLFPEPMRETSWFTVQPGAPGLVQQAAFVPSKPPTLDPASDTPCGGKGVAAADPVTETSTPVVPTMADNPKHFGTIGASVMRYKNQWHLALYAKPWRLGNTYYDEQVQLTLKGVAGHSEPVHVTNLQPASLPGNYQVVLDDIGAEAVVCYTAKDSTHPTPMRMTTWYKVNAGDTAANFTPSREPTLVPASSAPCE